MSKSSFSVGRVVGFCCVLLSLAGCGASATAPKAAQASSTSYARPTAPVASTAGGDANANLSCEARAIYFAFDSAELDASAREALNQDARCLQAQPGRATTVVGMTDPRGTEEYNMALGERRARATVAYLQALGVQQGGIAAHSVGEEQAVGQDEPSWASDRRAELQRN